jgi:hypothetical protein
LVLVEFGRRTVVWVLDEDLVVPETQRNPGQSFRGCSERGVSGQLSEGLVMAPDVHILCEDWLVDRMFEPSPIGNDRVPEPFDLGRCEDLRNADETSLTIGRDERIGELREVLSGDRHSDRPSWGDCVIWIVARHRPADIDI